VERGSCGGSVRVHYAVCVCGLRCVHVWICTTSVCVCVCTHVCLCMRLCVHECVSKLLCVRPCVHAQVPTECKNVFNPKQHTITHTLYPDRAHMANRSVSRGHHVHLDIPLILAGLCKWLWQAALDQGSWAIHAACMSIMAMTLPPDDKL